ncbi:MAG: sodium:proton antiporter [Alphaproteobacteria bacterium]|uniref:Sodium:proton antiporter n=1 Tax=Candidatus Nitrobium versatile TaxID=2884831 RepID=A0A953JD73_9BACT|nr:sodium:proton antiporter [Candidatus Nitrobium versatile]
MQADALVPAVSLGAMLPLWSTVPFAGMLLSIALFPLVAPRFWHHYFVQVSVFWSVIIVALLLFLQGGGVVHDFLHLMVADYLPFIILLGALYTISGGILIRGSLRGTPLLNTGILAVGTLLASWMGTTGAAMLLIRPLLRANAHRKHRTFIVVFFIFLVANIGGALTPLGDPPLFLGFLIGVPFFWTLAILPHMALAAGVLLVVYYFLDRYFFTRESPSLPPEEKEKEPLRVEGGYNFLLLLGVVGAVLLSGTVHWREISLFGMHRALQDLVRDALLLLISFVSLVVTPRRVREDNEFSWAPIKEVAVLFAGIFLTMLPCLKILQAGEQGALGFLTGAVREPVHYFWITGILSSFLDNAPTYLTFLSTALGGFYPGIPETKAVAQLIRERELYLEAISAGAVFFGAVTYIGNAPNFLVRSIAEEAGVPMPSFFGYVIKYSLTILMPVFLVITFVFF